MPRSHIFCHVAYGLLALLAHLVCSSGVDSHTLAIICVGARQWAGPILSTPCLFIFHNLRLITLSSFTDFITSSRYVVIVTEAGSSRSGRFLKLFFSQSSDVFSALAVLVTMRHINSRLHYITLQTVRCCQTEFVSVYQVLTKSSQCENCFCYKELKHDVKFVLY